MEFNLKEDIHLLKGIELIYYKKIRVEAKGLFTSKFKEMLKDPHLSDID